MELTIIFFIFLYYLIFHLFNFFSLYQAELKGVLVLCRKVRDARKEWKIGKKIILSALDKEKNRRGLFFILIY